MSSPNTPFGPTGEAVYRRTYSREVSKGIFEEWHDTVRRVAKGNLAFVYGDDMSHWSSETKDEYSRLVYHMDRMALLPAGRQLWATGVEGRQFLFNCHVSGWGKKFSEHFSFTFMRLVEGGGVGANYSTEHYKHYGAPRHPIKLVLTADESHPDYEKMKDYLADPAEFDAAVARDSYHEFRGDGVVADTREGWAAALEEVIDEAMSIYGREDAARVVYLDLSKIRPEGSPLVSSGGVASGPAPLAIMLTDVVKVLNRGWAQRKLTPIDIMAMDHIISVGAIAGGKRRSARMSICKWDDPYILDFIDSKKGGKEFWTTNISIEIDNEFINLITGGPGGEVRRLQAETVHQAACNAVLANGEPGYWNSDLAKVGETGTIIATNPCGEIALEAWEACNLGHVNLDAFVDKDYALGYNYEAVKEAHELVTRFLIRSTYADINDPRQREIQDRNRRIGVGHLGVQGFFVKAYEIPYSLVPFCPDSGMVMPKGFLRQMKNIVRQTARDYAFELRIPEPVKVTTVAPTGSIAKLPGVSEGIHPIYARWYERRVRFSLRDDREFEQVQEYIAQGFRVEEDIYDPTGMTQVVVFPTEDILVAQVRELGLDTDLVESAEQLNIEQMLAFQAFYQENWADNAVSYTVNIPEGTVTPDELGQILAEYLPKLKGTTIMVDASREQAPYTRITEEEYAVAAAKTVEDSTDLECSTGACPIK